MKKPKAKYKLFTAPRTGSQIAELAFAQCGLKPEIIEINYDDVAAEKSKELLKYNPLSRLPTVVLPDGQVLTESGAIVMYLGRKFPKSGLIINSPLFYRLLFILTGELYPTFTFSDDPSEWVEQKDCQAGYHAKVGEFKKEVWGVIASLLPAKGPWALGSKFSAIDIYLTIMSLWSPGEKLTHTQFPRIGEISAKVKALPRFKEILKRNKAI